MSTENPDTDTGSRANHGECGQTNIDLLIGVSVFLIAIGVVLTTAPGITDPFVDGGTSPLVADRTAELLVEGMFRSPGTPDSLEMTCVFAFFNTSMGAGTCAVGYDELEPDLAARLGLPLRYELNVTIRRPVTGDPASEVLCADGGSVKTCPGSTRLAAGPPPPESGSTVTSQRGATLRGTDVIVEVVLW